MIEGTGKSPTVPVTLKYSFPSKPFNDATNVAKSFPRFTSVTVIITFCAVTGRRNVALTLMGCFLLEYFNIANVESVIKNPPFAFPKWK